MADYIFTFEDGSKALMHKGVKGMRWRKGRKSDIKPLLGGGNAAKSRANVKGRLRGLFESGGKSKKSKEIKLPKRKGSQNRKSESHIRVRNQQTYSDSAGKYKQIEEAIKARKRAGYGGHR